MSAKLLRRLLTRRNILVASGALAVIAALAWYSQRPKSLDDADRIAVVEELTRWILTGHKLPGNEQVLYDLSFFADSQIVVTYDDPRDAPLQPIEIPERSIQVVSREDRRKIYAEHGYKGYTYVRISRIEIEKHRLIYEVSVMFGNLGGEGYLFEITKTKFGLQYRATESWMS